MGRLKLPGHNGGPPLDVEPGAASWRQWCWTRARRRGWTVLREVAPARLKRAEATGMPYRGYALETMERGRFP